MDIMKRRGRSSLKRCWSKKPIVVLYLSRTPKTEKRFTLHLQGLVSRYSVPYLLATVDDYDDIHQLSMHHIETAVLSVAT